jgi:hypothetical protein
MSIDNGSNESLEALLARSGLGIEDYEHLALTFHFRDAAQADLFLTTLASRSDAGEVRPAEVKAMAVRLLRNPQGAPREPHPVNV